jgi:hypothetical protein
VPLGLCIQTLPIHLKALHPQLQQPVVFTAPQPFLYGLVQFLVCGKGSDGVVAAFCLTTIEADHTGSPLDEGHQHRFQLSERTHDHSQPLFHGDPTHLQRVGHVQQVVLMHADGL